MDNSLPLIGRDITFASIDNEVLLIKRMGNLSRINDGVVTALHKGMPYGFLEVISHKFDGPAMLALTHKEDYLNAWKAIEDRGLNDNEEVLVIWSKSNYKNGLYKFLSFAMPKTIIWICPKGAYQIMHNSEFKPELKGEERFKAKVPLVEFKPQVMQ